jgi:hypothetical protein
VDESSLERIHAMRPFLLNVFKIKETRAIGELVEHASRYIEMIYMKVILSVHNLV